MHCLSGSSLCLWVSMSHCFSGSLIVSLSLGLSPPLWISHCLPGSLSVSLSLSGSLSVSLGPSLSLTAPGLCLRAETACGNAGDREERGSGRSGQERVFVQGSALIPWPRGHRRNPGLGNEPRHTPLAKHTPALAPAVNI